VWSLIGQSRLRLIINVLRRPVAMVSLLVSESAVISGSQQLAQSAPASSFFSVVIALVQPLCIVSRPQLRSPLFFVAIGEAEIILSSSFLTTCMMRAVSRYFFFVPSGQQRLPGHHHLPALTTIAIIIETPEAAYEMLGNSLPRMSSFFFIFVTMTPFSIRRFCNNGHLLQEPSRMGRGNQWA
jgi:calcium permeable stress-gated cation channel